MAQTTVEYPKVPVEQITKTWLATIDGLNKLQEQNEKIFVNMLEYNKEIREEGRRIAEKMLTQIAENQKNVATLVEAATKTVVAAFEAPVNGAKKN